MLTSHLLTRLAWNVWGIALVTFVLGISVSRAEWYPFDPVPTAAPPIPATDDPAWQANPIDGFILARLREKGLSPAPEVDRATWLRRVTFDLTGLPPTPEEREAFLTDPREDELAYGSVVDRLLSSPRYGEHWARHWLDVVRYADTDGFAIDGERPLLWRYRDYVIRTFNDDLPYDQFVREQIAGDELDLGPEGRVASSFYRLGPYELDNMTPENRRQDFLNEMTSTISSAFLGMTVGCARCHDHKYDPIPQADFYRLQAFLQPYDRKAIPAEFLEDELTTIVRDQRDAAQAELKQRETARDTFRAELKQELASALNVPVEELDEELFNKALQGEAIALTPVVAAESPAEEPADSAAEPSEPSSETSADEDAQDNDKAQDQKDVQNEDDPAGADKTETSAEEASTADETPEPTTFQFTQEQRDKLAALQKAIDDYDVAKRFEPVADALGAQEKVEDVPATHVLLNGDVFAKADAVQPGCLTAVDAWSDELQARIEACSNLSEGRRVVLADWLASPENPLTSRVYVNRIWQFHFGTGIVKTANDFGENGSGASHPELLDFLTRYFLDHDWRTKPLHRLIVLSRTYRSASDHDQWETCAEVDPDNRLLWRAPLRRLQAESIRDALLAVSHQLNTATGGPGFFEVLPEGMGADYPFFSWRPSSEEQRRRRSIYMFQRRNLVHPMMEAFDVADMSQPCERRGTAVTAAQSLALFNGKLVEQASGHLADQLAALETDAQRVETLFLRAFNRMPSGDEIRDCSEFLDAKRMHYTAAEAEAEPEAESEAEPAQASTPPSADVLALRDLCRVTLCSNEFLYLD